VECVMSGLSVCAGQKTTDVVKRICKQWNLSQTAVKHCKLV
jgi:hypothetical protein